MRFPVAIVPSLLLLCAAGHLSLEEDRDTCSREQPCRREGGGQSLSCSSCFSEPACLWAFGFWGHSPHRFHGGMRDLDSRVSEFLPELAEEHINRKIMPSAAGEPAVTSGLAYTWKAKFLIG